MASYIFQKDNMAPFEGAVSIYYPTSLSCWQYGQPNTTPLWQGAGGLSTLMASIDPAVFRRFRSPLNNLHRPQVRARRGGLFGAVGCYPTHTGIAAGHSSLPGSGSYLIGSSGGSLLPMPSLTLLEDVWVFRGDGSDGGGGSAPPRFRVFACIASAHNGQYIANFDHWAYDTETDDPGWDQGQGG